MKTRTLNASRKTKRTPIGEIPVEWEVRALGQCLREPLRNGFSPACPEKPTGSWVLSLASVTLDGFNPKGAKPAPDDQRLFGAELEVGDIVVSRSNTRDLVGLAALYTGVPCPCYYSDLLIRVRTNSTRLVPAFALLALQSQAGRKYFSRSARGTSGSMVKINGQILERFLLPLPDIKEQIAIAQAVEMWSKYVERLDHVLGERKRIKSALMQQLLTRKRRFPRFGKSGGKSSKDWKWVRTDELFESYSKKNGVGLPLLSVTQDRGVVLRDSLERKIDSSESSIQSYKIVESGSFVISLRSFQGGLEYSPYHGLVSPAYHVIRARSELCPEFYKYYFKSAHFIGHLAVAVVGIRDGKQVNYSDFAFMRLPCPPIDEQRQIAGLLSECDKEIVLLTRQLAALRRQKAGLMQKLLTGKVRVKG